MVLDRVTFGPTLDYLRDEPTVLKNFSVACSLLDHDSSITNLRSRLHVAYAHQAVVSGQYADGGISDSRECYAVH